MIVEEKEFSEPKELLITLGFNFDIDTHIFRGHSSGNYELIPFSLRENGGFWDIHDRLSHFDKILWTEKKSLQKQEKYQMEAEFRILREFYKLCDMNGLYIPNNYIIRKKLLSTYHLMMSEDKEIFQEWLPEQLYEVAALAQHYGLPTRLLDWTRDPFVAAFFALDGALEKDDGLVVIWALDISNIMSNKKLGSKLKIITPPYKFNPNLHAQKGVFTHWAIKFDELLVENPKAKNSISISDFFPIDADVNRKPLNELITEVTDQKRFIKYILPSKKAHEGLKLLNHLGYNKSRLFPGYQGIVEQIKAGQAIIK